MTAVLSSHPTVPFEINLSPVSFSSSASNNLAASSTAGHSGNRDAQSATAYVHSSKRESDSGVTAPRGHPVYTTTSTAMLNSNSTAQHDTAPSTSSTTRQDINGNAMMGSPSTSNTAMSNRQATSDPSSSTGIPSTQTSTTRSMSHQHKLVTGNTNTMAGEVHSQGQYQQQMHIPDMNKHTLQPSYGQPSSNNNASSASSSRSGTPVNGSSNGRHNHHMAGYNSHPRSQSPSAHHRIPSPSPNVPPLSHLIAHPQHSPHASPLPPNMAAHPSSHSPSQQSSNSSSSSSVPYDAGAAVAQAQATAMMQAAYAQQQQHFRNQMAAMLAAGYSQHQLAQHFGQQQPPPLQMNGGAYQEHVQQQQQQGMQPHMTAGHHLHHDPRRRAPSLPNNPMPPSPNGNNGMTHNAGYFPSQASPQQYQQHQHYQHHPNAQPQQHSFPHHSQQYYHPQFAQQQYHHIQQQQQPQYSPQFMPPQPNSMRRSPVPSNHSPSSSGRNTPSRERAPTAPSSVPSSPMSAPIIGHTPSPNSARSAPNAALAPHAPSSPGGVADLARRRAESQPNDNRAPLAPTTASQVPYAGGRDRTPSTSSEGRKAAMPHHSNIYARPPQSSSSSPSSSPSIQLNHKLSADLAVPSSSRSRTDSGTSNGSAGTSTSQKSGNGNRPASPASVLSDRAPTPTQALHSQLAGSSTSARSGRTTPTAPSSSSSSVNAQQQQQQQLGLQPSIKLANGSHEPHGIIRKASPLSQQSSSYDDGHRSITPTQASASGIVNGHGPEHDDDDETEEIAASKAAASAPSTQSNLSKHRATLSNASSSISSTSPQTPSSHKSGSSLFRNKLRKAMSLSELNNSSSTLSSSSTNPTSTSSSSSKKLGRTSLTSNSSSSDTSHSIAEPRTPPNGDPPVLPRGFATASASNLHDGSGVDEHGMQQSNNNGRATPTMGSLPSNTGRRFGILNSKMNSSTDNISISSTVSSASMMLRKMGNFGKLARKSSVRSLSNLFSRDKHDKDDDSTISGGGNGRKVTSDAVSEFGVPGAAMVSSKDRKKGALADPSVAHVTVELERGDAGKMGASGMTPAEALVRKHQERERVQREEQERNHARARTASAASVNTMDSTSSTAQDVPSPRSRLLEKEKERLKAQNAGKKSLTKKFSFGAFGKSSASSASLRQEASSVSASGQTVEDKESPRSSSSSSSANASPIFDSSATSSSSVSPVILQHDLDTKDFSKPLDIDFRPSLDGIQLDTWRKGPAALAGTSSTLAAGIVHREDALDDDENDEGFDDRTPRQSMELIGDQSVSSSSAGNYSDWDGEPPNTSSYFDDDTASFNNEPEHAGKSNAANAAPFYKQQKQDQDGYSSDSGADGRSGQAIPKRPHPSARPSKGILKTNRSNSQDQLRGPQPAFASRPRASSYDAPQQMSPPNQPGKLATLAQFIPSGAELDGVALHPSTTPRQDTRVASPSEIDYNKENMSPSSSASFHPGTSPYNHPNTSEPVLSNMKSVHMATRSVTNPVPKRNISFAQNLSVHTTWSGSTYDRRGETATCNRLTPQLAQAIKEELNAYKMEEMAVHHQSRGYTHFFV